MTDTKEKPLLGKVPNAMIDTSPPSPPSLETDDAEDDLLFEGSGLGDGLGIIATTPPPSGQARECL